MLLNTKILTVRQNQSPNKYMHKVPEHGVQKYSKIYTFKRKMTQKNKLPIFKIMGKSNLFRMSMLYN